MHKVLRGLATGLCVALCGLFVVPQQTWAADVTALESPVNATALVDADVTSAPAADAPVVGALAVGDPVSVLGHTTGWLQVSGPKGVAGYVPAEAVAVPVVSVTLPATQQVPAGKTAAVPATVFPECATNPTLKWTSSDLAVASVDSSGVVTGKKAGSVTITATAAGVSAKTAVTVTPAGLAVSPATAVVKVGKTLTLTALGAPADATVAWSSAKTKIATVSNVGAVKGKAAGTAKITATTPAGAVSATVKVSKAASTLTISKPLKVPALLQVGTALKVAGTVKSNYTITSVTATLATDTEELLYSASAQPNATSYNLSDFAPEFAFDKLDVLVRYKYTVKATDASGKVKTLTNATFFVSYGKPASGCVSLNSATSYDNQFPVRYTAPKGSVEAFLQIALSQVGYHEGNYSSSKKCVSFPSYHNWSKYGLYVGWPKTMRSPNSASYMYAWCAAFVSWVAWENGIVGTKVPNYIATAVGWKWFNARGKFHKAKGYTPKPGDIVFYGPNKNPHTGIVLRAGENGAYTSVEGNTNDEVRIKDRNINSRDYVVFGFGSWS